jgi:hypothetical protein
MISVKITQVLDFLFILSRLNYEAFKVVHVYQQQKTKISLMKKLREEPEGRTLQL